MISFDYRKMAYTPIFNCCSANDAAELVLQEKVDYQQSQEIGTDRG